MNAISKTGFDVARIRQDREVGANAGDVKARLGDGVHAA